MTDLLAHDVKRIVQRELWFEEFELGAVYEHCPDRTATEDDNVLFSTQTVNTRAPQLDAAYSESTPVASLGFSRSVSRSRCSRAAPSTPRLASQTSRNRSASRGKNRRPRTHG
jgi:acyl dehydratase